MSEAVETHDEAEKRDPTELSIGNIVAWVVGGLSILAGVASLFDQPVMGVGFLIGGVFGMPPTRNMIEREFNIKMSRWFATLGYLVIIFAFAGIAQA